MSSFLGKIRNLLTEKQATSPLPSSSLAKVYGGSLESPEALINRANKRAVTGDIDGAIEDFNEAIQINPAKATAYFNRGFLHNTVGRFEQAILDFSEAIQLLPDYDEAYFHRAMGRAQLEDLQGAVDDFSQALRINPFCIKAYYKRAEVLAELGDQQGALADYSQAIMNVPQDANAYYRRGLFLSKLGEQPTAIEDFTKAIEFNPKHADAHFNRGYCYAQLGDESKATRDFSQALLHDPNHKAAQYNRAYALGVLKEVPAESKPSLMSAQVETATVPQVVVESSPVPQPIESAVSSPIPESLEVSWSDASLGSRLEEPASPTPTAPTVKMEPESVEGYFERAQNRALNGDLSGAIDDYTEIIGQDPHNTQAYYQRGQSLSALGETDAAMQDLEQAIHWTRLHSLDRLKDFSGELADTIATLKREGTPRSKPVPSSLPPIEAAIEASSQAILKNPNNGQAYFERAQSRALLGDLEGAIADYTETIRLDPSRSDAFYKRGRSRSALGDIQGATEDFNNAIRRDSLSKRSQLSGVSMPMGTKEKQQLSPHRIPTSQCDHMGNLPENRFCIHCGMRLEVAPPRKSVSTPRSEAETLFEQGVALAQAGDKIRAIKALASALSLFLEQQQMERYQETMKLMQQFSDHLSS